MSPGWMGEVSSPGSPLGRMLPLGGAPRVRPGLAATGPLLHEGARSKKKEERRGKKQSARSRIEEGDSRRALLGIRHFWFIVTGGGKRDCKILPY